MIKETWELLWLLAQPFVRLNGSIKHPLENSILWNRLIGSYLMGGLILPNNCIV